LFAQIFVTSIPPIECECERHFKLLTLSINFLRAQKLTPTALNELGEVERATRIAQLFALGLFVKNQQTHEPRPTTVQHQSRARQCYINLTFTHQTKRILSALISTHTNALGAHMHGKQFGEILFYIICAQ
jgi:hypothetical protein